MRSRSLATALSALAAAACFMFVAVDRWAICLTGDRDACFAREDDSYNRMLEAAGSAQPFILALGYGLLALSFLLAARRRRAVMPPALLLALSPAAYVLLLAIGRWASWGHLLPAGPISMIYTLGPFMIPAAALWFGHRAGMGTGQRALLTVGSFMTAFLVDFVMVAPLLMGGYVSHNTTPYSWVSSAVGSLLVGIAFA